MEKIETGIYRLPDGRLTVKTTAQDPYTGGMKWRRATLPEGATIEDARRKIATLKGQVTSRKVVPVKARTVQDYAAFWLEGKLSTLKPSVKRGYMRALEVLDASIGNLPIGDVVRADVLRWRRHLEDMVQPNGSHYSTHTLRGWWRISKIMWADAVADGLIAVDPSARLDPPTTRVVQVQERQTLTGAELGALVAAAQTGGRYAEIVTLAYTGMRSGELYGLTWEALDLDAGIAIIRKAVSGRTLVDSTKTGAPREVPLPGIVVEALRAHAAQTGSTTGLVFPSTVDTPRNGDTLRKALDAAVDAVNKQAKKDKRPGITVKVRPQVLRRTLNTLLVEAGVDRIVQRSMLGHTTEQMTERYSGVRMESKRAAVLRIVEGG